jgi:hypothetical protein
LIRMVSSGVHPDEAAVRLSDAALDTAYDAASAARQLAKGQTAQRKQFYEVFRAVLLVALFTEDPHEVQ